MSTNRPIEIPDASADRYPLDLRREPHVIEPFGVGTLVDTWAYRRHAGDRIRRTAGNVFTEHKPPQNSEMLSVKTAVVGEGPTEKLRAAALTIATAIKGSASPPGEVYKETKFGAALGVEIVAGDARARPPIYTIGCNLKDFAHLFSVYATSYAKIIAAALAEKGGKALEADVRVRLVDINPYRSFAATSSSSASSASGPSL